MSGIRIIRPLTFNLVGAALREIGNRFGVKSYPNGSNEVLEHKLYLNMDTHMPAARPLHVQALFDMLFDLQLSEELEIKLLGVITEVATATNLPDMELTHRNALEQLADLNACGHINAGQGQALRILLDQAAKREL
jgi:hypothetical protein